LIEDRLVEKCQQDEAFAVRYQQELGRRDSNQDASFFVKNLENVQGDERDIMIFSTTFGPDTEGRFYRRFGPVGALGGERRLNVAVTRSKKQIIILGSMPIAQVADAFETGDLPGSALTPAGYLQLYLAYAQAVSQESAKADAILTQFRVSSPSVRPQGDVESPFEEDVLKEVEKMGYDAETQVGDGGFRIDIAIRHPKPERGYVLGIECDGATYHSDRSARIRDVWRSEILRQRGWTLYRIWSTQWWFDRLEEIRKLKTAIDKAKRDA
jgi:very-short-patch-repair endonuclease